MEDECFDCVNPKIGNCVNDSCEIPLCASHSKTTCLRCERPVCAPCYPNHIWDGHCDTCYTEYEAERDDLHDETDALGTRDGGYDPYETY
jgi:hypothetical protein